jgi:hypothetical protein
MASSLHQERGPVDAGSAIQHHAATLTGPAERRGYGCGIVIGERPPSAAFQLSCPASATMMPSGRQA